MKITIAVAPVLAAILALAPLFLAQAQTAAAPQVETLLSAKSSWDGTPYKSYPKGRPMLSVLKITIPPHSALDWHSHPMPNAGYVLSGQLTVERKDNGKKQVVTQGQALPEMVDAIHRGISGDTPTVLIVFYAGAEGMPLSQKLPQKSSQ